MRLELDSRVDNSIKDEQLLGSFLCGVCESTVSGEMCVIFSLLLCLNHVTLKLIKALS